jgi:hypothetical protein
MLESWLRYHPATIPDLAAERAVQDRNRSVTARVSRSAGHANEISAVVLTTGEPTTQAAIDSLHRQTAALADIIVVRDIAPFHKALNAGVTQVKTPFFVQVDADMVLDDHCIDALRSGMRRDVGIVVGHLRDPLIGQVVGVKLFRTACFQIGMFEDSISPDTDFVADIARPGWKTVYIGRVRTPAHRSYRHKPRVAQWSSAHQGSIPAGRTFCLHRSGKRKRNFLVLGSAEIGLRLRAPADAARPHKAVTVHAIGQELSVPSGLA